jgi:glutamine amidotransferase-like uncharacterized protein
MNTFIYTDNVSNNHILYYSLGKLLGKKNVYFVNANEILQGALTSDIDLLVMPGGASRYKSDKLDGAANSLIKKYVAEGGRYLGICAGSYMACEVTCWATGQPFEITTKNELGFFPGSAIGPIPHFGQGDNYNSTKARLTTLNFNGQHIESLYLGGCLFHSDAEAEYTVLATFDELPEKPAAVVFGHHGKGRWLLSSTHPEYDREAIELMTFNVIGNEYQDFSALKPSQNLNLDMLNKLLNQLFE